MHYVYILQSFKDKKTYIGSTNNLERRLQEHNAGKVRSTQHRRPFQLLFMEERPSAQDAKQRELWWKSGAGRRKLKTIFKNIPPIFPCRNPQKIRLTIR